MEKHAGTPQQGNDYADEDHHRAHKRRQRQRRKQEKDDALFELLNKVPSEITAECAYCPIAIPEATAWNFWQEIDLVLTPDNADIEEVIDEQYLSAQKKLMRKQEKKYLKQLEDGDITEEKFRHILEQKSRKDSTALLSNNRGLRKRQQVENFLPLVDDDRYRRIIDFGSGSGNLTLSLAKYFPSKTFVLVDKNAVSLDIARNRAASAKLSNVEFIHKLISFDSSENEEAFGRFDLGIGLHCCGSFTDMVMDVCAEQRADCVVCPCCNGKLHEETDTTHMYPRSQAFQNLFDKEEWLQQISRGADSLNHYDCKKLLEYDRGLWAREAGYSVDFLRLTPVSCTTKHHVVFMRKERTNKQELVEAEVA